MVMSIIKTNESCHRGRRRFCRDMRNVESIQLVNLTSSHRLAAQPGLQKLMKQKENELTRQKLRRQPAICQQCHSQQARTGCFLCRVCFSEKTLPVPINQGCSMLCTGTSEIRWELSLPGLTNALVPPMYIAIDLMRSWLFTVTKRFHLIDLNLCVVMRYIIDAQIKPYTSRVASSPLAVSPSASPSPPSSCVA